jgi:hypothetical protein
MVIFQSNVNAVLSIVNNFLGSFYYEYTHVKVLFFVWILVGPIGFCDMDLHYNPTCLYDN